MSSPADTYAERDFSDSADIFTSDPSAASLPDYFFTTGVFFPRDATTVNVHFVVTTSHQAWASVITIDEKGNPTVRRWKTAKYEQFTCFTGMIA